MNILKTTSRLAELFSCNTKITLASMFQHISFSIHLSFVLYLDMLNWPRSTFDWHYSKVTCRVIVDVSSFEIVCLP